MPTDIIHPPTLELPNLDCMSADELRAFWNKWHTVSRRKAATLVGVRKNAIRYTSLLASYAIHKAVAVRARTQGLLTTALRYEKYCEGFYKQLPTDLKG